MKMIHCLLFIIYIINVYIFFNFSFYNLKYREKEYITFDVMSKFVFTIN